MCIRDRSQIDKIEAYLKAQTASSGEIQAEECPAAVQVKMAPLSMDEQRYLKDYEESLQWVAPPETRELEKLYQAMSAGKTLSLIHIWKSIRWSQPRSGL